MNLCYWKLPANVNLVTDIKYFFIDIMYQPHNNHNPKWVDAYLKIQKVCPAGVTAKSHMFNEQDNDEKYYI